MIEVKNDWNWISKHVEKELEDETLYEAVHMYMKKYNIDLSRVKELYHDAVDYGMENGKYLSFSEWFYLFADDDIAKELKTEKIKDIFYKCYNGDTDWSIAADRFIEWTIAKNFQTESFKEFVSWIDDSEIGKLWDFFFDYGDNFKKFADDWIEPEEKESYLRYCLDHQ